MKKQSAHIAFFALTALLLIAASVLVYNQWVTDSEQQTVTARYEATHDVEDTEMTVIDTTRFFENPCYSYCATRSEGCDEKVEELRKTVLTIEQNGQDIRELTAADLKRLPANTSLNMMLDSYTVSRAENEEGTSYYVTVESFDAVLEKMNGETTMMTETGGVYETYRLEDITEWLDQTCAREKLQELRQRTERPL